ncbi:MAG: hypothetical protein LQ345_004103 [Seirophora villosa]|nr:MAG: hypothetical protein LQ345_004103 [Seirophora villosa]
MKSFVALAALAAAVTAQIPDGCSTNSQGSFLISTQNVTGAPGQFDKRQITASQACGNDDTAVITLNDSVLEDRAGRTGGIVANGQFQFDEDVQTNSRYLDGFSICGNGSLAVAGSTIFYQCLSGSFYNLYQANEAEQCNEVYILTIPCSGGGSAAANPSSASASASTPASTATPATSSAAAPVVSTTSPAPSVVPTTESAPFPVPSNATAPGPTATGTGVTPPPPAFTGAASTIVIGGNLLALVAAIGAFAMF